ncbi:MAG TPA: site-2 protease family protein [Polyangia bacterium]|nr:site-2 protease family protein [Polyangia bacterium]
MSGPAAARPVAARPRQRSYLLHVGLFLATFLTTTAAGALYVHGQNIRPIADGLPYSVPLLMILVCHEFGHYFAARAHGVDASLPFFIPLPPGLGLGTMGAVIGMRNVTRDRRKLIDIGAAGPLAGLGMAIPIILYGLSLSKVAPAVPHSIQEGNSLLYALLKFMAKGAWLPGHNQDVFMHPTAWAGWAGLLVTMINLMPIGQLDGGHIATAYFGNGYRVVARRLHRLLPLAALAVFVWVYLNVRREAGTRWDWVEGAIIAFGGALPWVVWYVIVAAVGRLGGGPDHPPVDEQPLPRSRRFLFWVVVVAFIGIFMPVPYRETLAGSDAAAAPGATAAGADATVNPPAP